MKLLPGPRGLLLLSFLVSFTACSSGGGGGGGGSDASYTVGGTVTGLAGGDLVLQNNGGDDLPISGDGAFTFATALDDGSTYTVSVATQPDLPPQSCTVSNAAGTLGGADVVNVDVDCAGPFGRFVYALSLGSDAVSTYALDDDTGALVFIRNSPTGAAPSAAAVHPTGRYLYVTNEDDDNVSQYAIAADGSLSEIDTALSSGSFGGPVAATVDPTGRYLYVASKGVHSISQFLIGADGALTAMTPALVLARRRRASRKIGQAPRA